MRISDWSSDVCSSDLALTTGNFGGFDAVLAENGADASGGHFELTCNHGSLSRPLAELGRDDIILEAGGLERRIRVFRLPDDNPHRRVAHRLRIPLKPQGDNPLWVCVTTEDGRSEEHTSELQSLMRTSYPGFCLKK